MLISCKNCHAVYEKHQDDDGDCLRCGYSLSPRVSGSYQTALALTLCACLLYIPAMWYPMMEVTQFGVSTQSNIMQGVISFLEYKNYFIALVIFTASVVIPLVKLLGLLFILLSVTIKLQLNNKLKIKLFKFVEAIGKWSMIDIYVVAILASTVQLNEIFNIKGGIAATSFSMVVILTMMAANRFDTRIIWDD